MIAFGAVTRQINTYSSLPSLLKLIDAQTPRHQLVSNMGEQMMDVVRSIVGAEGWTEQQILTEIGRGGKLVAYMYTFSFVIMTIKRVSAVRLIPAGSSAAVSSWPYVLITFLVGWWGIPWGPVYTIQSIWRNLRGGIDVTDQSVILVEGYQRLAVPKFV